MSLFGSFFSPFSQIHGAFEFDQCREAFRLLPKKAMRARAFLFEGEGVEGDAEFFNRFITASSVHSKEGPKRCRCIRMRFPVYLGTCH